MKAWIAFWNIMAKDARTYYLKPPNISWGLIFPFAWAGMFFIRAGGAPRGMRELLPGLMVLSVLFGTTSLLSVTVTFEKKSRSFERLLLAPMPLELLMLAKTSGAILFGIANAFVPLLLSAFFINLKSVNWFVLLPSVVLIAACSTFLGLFIAVSVSEVFEAQTFSNFFRFPMVFLCGLFFPIGRLPVFLRPLSYILPLTYGADAVHGAVLGGNALSYALDFSLLGAFCAVLFVLCSVNINRKWIL